MIKLAHLNPKLIINAPAINVVLRNLIIAIALCNLTFVTLYSHKEP